ncbi:hypothetical protein [Acetobacter oeni]|uniref:Uncharacterized protein n=1 Tax=Acetobacter oeni TaxID=304077 RepID=A0A511XNL9_9PROT|nr:hypothetical protein [Acetobacter oeni]MBB3884323.1 hypothetical protein [Acetobacter oeni]NHO20322.1 hypothetical protein [Acetobacter oeni]GBR05209.1 hypothetical protein AA21952_1659 [Acetobacter oeni LMG 21952]GEN64499.1 hypothetical protein AOE01nite_27230 [Acetobacter oeni]
MSVATKLFVTDATGQLDRLVIEMVPASAIVAGVRNPAEDLEPQRRFTKRA